jgi:hypothetical protein
MTHTVKVYKNGILLGTGTGTAGSASITSYTGDAPGFGRNVQVTCTTGTNATGKTYNTRLLSGTSTLVMRDADPFAD